MPARSRFPRVVSHKRRGGSAKLPPMWFLPILLAAPPVHWTDLAPAAGISGSVGPAASGIGGGAAVLDADGDGVLDIVVLAALAPPRLLRQTSAGWVVDELALLPDLPASENAGVVTLDLEGDGDRDVLLLREGLDALMRNDGGSFYDVSATHLPRDGWWTVSAAVGDVDGDGDDDVAVANYIGGQSFPAHQGSPNRLLLNDGAGRFEDVAHKVGVQGAGCSLAVLLADLDDDGDLDLLEVNDFGQFSPPSALYRNDGAFAGLPRFTDVTAGSGVDARIYGMGVDAADLDHDGRLDLMLTSIGRGVLLRQVAPLVFEDVTTAWGAAVPYESDGFQATWTPLFADLDFDGHRELFMTGGYVSAAGFIKNGQIQPNVLLGGPVPFHLDPPSVVIAATPTNRARGVSLGDVTGDGLPELVVAHAHGALSVYSPDGGVASSVRPIPRETGATPSGLRLFATCGGVSRRFDLHGGGSFASAHDPALTVTVPGCSPGAPLSLVVWWPSGYVTTHTSSYGQGVVVVEPEWLTVDTKAVDVSPTDAGGLLVQDPTRLVARIDDGPPLEVEPLGATLGAALRVVLRQGESGSLSLEVDGRRLGVSPWVGSRPLGLRFQPGAPIIGQPASVLVPVEALTGGQLLLGGQGVAVETAHGLARATIPSVPAEPLEISVVAEGGAVLGSRLLEGTARVRYPGSRLRFKGHLRLDGDLAVPFATVLSVRDANGEAATEVELPAVLRLGEAAIPSQTANFAAGQALFGFPSMSVPHGTPFQLELGGVPFGPLGAVTHVEAPEALTSLVSAARSSCGPSQEWVEADGVDRVTFVLFLRDANGSPLPPEGPTPSLSPALGFTLQPPDTWTADDRQQIPAIAGTQVGLAEMEVVWHGAPLGILCRVRAVAPYSAPSALSLEKSTLAVVPDRLPLGFGSTEVRLTPRAPNGRLAGSGITPPTIETTSGTVEPFVYAGLGVWVGRWNAAASPELGTVTATVTSPALQLSVDVESYDPAALPDLGGGEGAVEDAGSVEPGDVAVESDTGAAEEVEPVPDSSVSEVHAPEVVPSEVESGDAPQLDVSSEDLGSVEPDVLAPPEGVGGPGDAGVAEPPPRSESGGSCSAGRPLTPLWLLGLVLLGRGRSRPRHVAAAASRAEEPT